MMHRKESMYRRVEQGHILTAAFGIILVGLAGVSLLLWRDSPPPQIFHVGIYTPIIIVIYFVAMRAAFIYERQKHPLPNDSQMYPDISLQSAVRRYLGAAAIVVVAGTWLPFVGVELADVMGWRTTFVGTLFVAGATSLPEVVVTISALRLGALDLAIANLLGSNLFDMLVLAIDDIAYLRGPLLAVASPAHAVTAFATIIMSGIFIVAVLYRPATRILGTIGWVSLSLLFAYLLTSYAIYLHGL
jgi:cation:H+ antiporter